MPVAAEPSLRSALGLHQILPAQQPGAAAASVGVRRFYAALLLGAVEEAGLGPRRGTAAPPPASSRAAGCCGELDGEVVVPLQVACGALGLDPEALADAVRLRSTRPLRQPRASAPPCGPWRSGGGPRARPRSAGRPGRRPPPGEGRRAGEHDDAETGPRGSVSECHEVLAVGD
jgi:hypothetical protein